MRGAWTQSCHSKLLSETGKKIAMLILERAAHVAIANISALLSKGIYFKPEKMSCTEEENRVSEGGRLSS